MFSYNGYDAEISYSDGDSAIHGTVINISDTIHFQGATIEELQQSFRDSVDDYLEWCAAEDRAPARPYSGTFVVRMDPDLHRQAALKAGPRKLNAFVVAAVHRAVDAPPASTRRSALKTAAKTSERSTSAQVKATVKKRATPKPASKKRAHASKRTNGSSTRVDPLT